MAFNIAVFVGTDEETTQIGLIRAGDNIAVAHYSTFEGWQFISYGSAGSRSQNPLFGWAIYDFWAQYEAVAG